MIIGLCVGGLPCPRRHNRQGTPHSIIEVSMAEPSILVRMVPVEGQVFLAITK